MEIITEEQHFLTINKPAGLFSQAASGIASVQTELAEFLKQRDQHSGNPYVGLPHRLDRATSGVMLIARNKRALAKFGDQFQSRKISKIYCAIFEGHLAESQTWIDHIAKVDGEPRAEIVGAEHPGGKSAKLIVEPIAAASGKTLARIELHTGRMHQIRIQAASRGLPVAGDATYGDASRTVIPTESEKTAATGQCADAGSQAEPRQHEAVGLMALHALSIGFHHPKTAKRMTVAAPVPEQWLVCWPDFAAELRTLSE